MSSPSPVPPPYEQPPKKDYAPMLLVLLGFGAAVGFGTCGLALLTGSKVRVSEFGAILCAVCLAGLLLVALFMIVRSISRSVRKPGL